VLSVRREDLQQMVRGIGTTLNLIGWTAHGMPDYSLRQIQITEMLIMVGLIHVEQCFTKAVWKSLGVHRHQIIVKSLPSYPEKSVNWKMVKNQRRQKQNLIYYPVTSLNLQMNLPQQQNAWNLKYNSTMIG